MKPTSRRFKLWLVVNGLLLLLAILSWVAFWKTTREESRRNAIAAEALRGEFLVAQLPSSTKSVELWLDQPGSEPVRALPSASDELNPEELKNALQFSFELPLAKRTRGDPAWKKIGETRIIGANKEDLLSIETFRTSDGHFGFRTQGESFQADRETSAKFRELTSPDHKKATPNRAAEKPGQSQKPEQN